MRAVQHAGVRHEFPVLHAVLDPFEVLAHLLHAALVAHHDHEVAQLLRAQCDMVNGPVGVEHEFARFDEGAGLGVGDGVHAWSTGVRPVRIGIAIYCAAKTFLNSSVVRATGSTRMRFSSSASMAKSPLSALSVT